MLGAGRLSINKTREVKIFENKHIDRTRLCKYTLQKYKSTRNSHF